MSVQLPIIFRITSLLVAFAFIPVLAFSSSDILSLLEKKGPRAKEVMTKPTIVRVSEMPHLPVNLRQGEWLIDHPHISMALAHIYDPSLDLYKIEVRPDGFRVQDPAGLEGDMEILSSIPGRRVYYISGHFDFLKMRFNGHMLMQVSYCAHQGEANTSADLTTTSHIRVNSAFIGFFTKVMTLIFPKKVDDRIGRFANAVRTVAIAVHNDPKGAYGRLVSSGEVSPAELKEFAGMFL